MTSLIYVAGFLVFLFAMIFVVIFSNKALIRKFNQTTKSLAETYTSQPLPLEGFNEALKDLLSSQSVLRADQTRAFAGLAKTLHETPAKTLATIQGSVNNTVGKMGEMMQLIELQKTYDRLIVVGDIIDFIGVKFEEEDSPGSIDFIDIKTGKSAALSGDQRKLRDLIASASGKVNFKVVKVQIT